MSTEKKITVVERSKWLRGDYYNSCLWDSTRGRGCCLGHRWHQLEGVEWEDMEGHGEPDAIYDGREYRDWKVENPGWLEEIPDKLANAVRGKFVVGSLLGFAMHVNDSITMDDNQREKLLKRTFKAAGEEIRFRGKG